MTAAKKYLVITYGCQMNEHDSERLAGMLEAAGYRPALREEDAGVIILNTCCVREKPENKVYGRLGRLKRLKERRPDLLIGVCGCMVQQPRAAEEMRRRAPYIDLIFGTHNLHRLPELLAAARATREQQVEIWKHPLEATPAGLPVKRKDGIKAYVTISYGCNNFCTYCIVPYVRGRERSRPPEQILAEVRQLAAEGYREVTLLGQNVNSYGRDLEEGIDFAGLLAAADQIDGIERLRYTTSHPRDFTQQLIDTIAASRHVCEHFHLPVQAGSNRVLEMMARGYNRAEYLDLVRRIREKIPPAAITTDLIVGFPGETEADFQDTLDLLEKVRFANAFSFIYSPRQGTRAARLPDQVPLEVKKERFNRLLEVQNRISWEINQELVGLEVTVLVEGPSKTNPDLLAGRTRTNKIVVFAGRPELRGSIVPVRITAAETWTLKGELIQ